MHRAKEKQFTSRAVELGNAADGAALPELAGMLLQPSVQVRRLASSAIGKLAGVADATSAVNAVVPLLNDSHPQVWHLRIVGMLDPEDATAPPADTITVLVLLIAAAPKKGRRQTLQTAEKIFTPLDAT